MVLISEVTQWHDRSVTPIAVRFQRVTSRERTRCETLNILRGAFISETVAVSLWNSRCLMDLTMRLLSLALLGCLAPAFAADKPNIVVILTDDQGWADVGYNNPKVYTPNMDRLAAEGATLTNHHSMPQCTPTRVALFTGRYPGRFGKSGLQASNRPILPHGTLTMASFLKSQGYETYLTGKWHMGSWAEHGPNHHGFDYSYGALAGAVGSLRASVPRSPAGSRSVDHMAPQPRDHSRSRKRQTRDRSGHRRSHQSHREETR